MDLNEGNIGLAASPFLEKGLNFNIFDCRFQRNLAYLSRGLSIQLWGNSPFSLRIVSLIMGLLSLIPLKFLIERLFSRRSAYWAITLMGFSHLFVHFTRDGLNNIDALLIINMGILIYIKALDSKKNFYYLLCGMLAGLSFYVYHGARILLFVIMLFYFFEWLNKKDFLKTHLVHLGFLILGFVVLFAPIISWQLNPGHTPDTRYPDVFLFTKRNIEHFYKLYNTDNILKIVAYQLINSFFSLTLILDRSINYGIRTPLLDIHTSTLFFLGLLLALAKPRKYLIFILWFFMGIFVFHGLTVLGAPCYAPRLVIIIPVIYVFVSFTLENIRSIVCRSCTALGVKKWGRIFNYLIWGYILFIAGVNYHIYYKDFLASKKANFFQNCITEIGYFVQPYVPQYYIVLFGDGINFLKHDNVLYLTNRRVKGRTVEPSKVNWKEFEKHHKILFLGLMRFKAAQEEVKKHYPQGKTLVINKLGEDRQALWGYLVN